MFSSFFPVEKTKTRPGHAPLMSGWAERTKSPGPPLRLITMSWEGGGAGLEELGKERPFLLLAHSIRVLGRRYFLAFCKCCVRADTSQQGRAAHSPGMIII